MEFQSNGRNPSSPNSLCTTGSRIHAQRWACYHHSAHTVYTSLVAWVLSSHWIAKQPRPVHKGNWGLRIATWINSSGGWNSMIECGSQTWARLLLLFPLLPFPALSIGNDGWNLMQIQMVCSTWDSTIPALKLHQKLQCASNVQSGLKSVKQL